MYHISVILATDMCFVIFAVYDIVELQKMHLAIKMNLTSSKIMEFDVKMTTILKSDHGDFLYYMFCAILYECSTFFFS